jgi:methionyl-tRNA formyltransferase
VRVVFFGTPAVAAGALEHLLGSSHQVAAVVTQPDRPRGRSGRPEPPPVKELAAARGLPALQPSSPRDPGFPAELGSLAPDVCAVVAYGHILPTEVLAVPPRGFVNVHFSLLPRYRGAAPVQRALMAGETETGVTTFLLEPTMDTGPILMQETVAIGDDDAGALLARLGEVGARLLVATLDAMERGRISPVPQDPGLASPAPKIKPEDAAIDWSRPAAEIVNLVRAMNPAPGAHTTFRGKRLKVSAAGRIDHPVPPGAAPGEVIPAGREGLVVAAGKDAVRLLRVQLEGGVPLDGASFLRGHRPEAGERLGVDRPHGRD